MHVGQEGQRSAALRESAAAAEAAAVAAKHVAAQHAVLALRRRLGRRAVTLAALGQALAGAAAAAGVETHAVNPSPDPPVAGVPGGPQPEDSPATNALASRASRHVDAHESPAAPHWQMDLPQGAGPKTSVLAPEQLPGVLQALLARHAAAVVQLRGTAAAAGAHAAELALKVEELRAAETQARASAASADVRGIAMARGAEELRAEGLQARGLVTAAEARSARLRGELDELRAAGDLARASSDAAKEAASARERAAAEKAAAAAACIGELQARLSVASAAALVARQVNAWSLQLSVLEDVSMYT